jgi:hypothetical protein
LSGNAAVEQMEVDRDGCGGTGLSDDVRAEMDAAFGYGLPLSEAEMDAQAAEHQADCRRNDEAALMAEWPTVPRLSDSALINVVANAPESEPFDVFTVACALELRNRVDGVHGRRAEAPDRLAALLADSVALEAAIEPLPPDAKRDVRRLAAGRRTA